MPRKQNQLNSNNDNFDIPSDELSNVDDDSNDLLLNYDPIEPKKTDYKTLSRNIANNKLKSSSFTNGEREEIVAREVLSARPSEPKGSANIERITDIAMNSREVRLVGPNKKEVEMKDDVASKFVVAMENLQKEATEVWGQVNERLDKGWTDLKRSEVWGQVNDKVDKGWTDLKTMVEGIVSPSTKQQKESAERKQI